MFPTIVRYSSLFVLVLLHTTLVRAESPPLYQFDLTYTLRIDTNDPKQVEMAWDHCHAVAALQGVVNRDEPRLYVRFVEAQTFAGNVDDYWLEKLTQPDGWLHGRTIEQVPTLVALLERFREQIDGVVVYDPKVAATSNVASTIAGVENLIPIRFDPSPQSLYSQLVSGGPQLPIRRRLVAKD
jgi:hypothetical protein